ncbi:universal stress protein [Halobacterium sp. CBA1126]|uniref:universal stress protein n=1 Tax=Halobacterium TaxID=2239 RepID=UPI0012FBCD2F|nr:universal stress protein [Halobacterium sp. CBA1126]MUV61692.1 universal stress protein [Halobacterium sp. CBA1126]
MDRALAVIDPTDAAKDLLHEAGTLAAGVDADLVVIHVTTEDEYGGRREAMEAIPNSTADYTPHDAEEGAAEFAQDLADEILADLDVEYETAGYLGKKAEKTLDAAAEYGCDHIFLAGRKRSPTGKAIFGDATQKVILDYDHPVTVLTA